MVSNKNSCIDYLELPLSALAEYEAVSRTSTRILWLKTEKLLAERVILEQAQASRVAGILVIGRTSASLVFFSLIFA